MFDFDDDLYVSSMIDLYTALLGGKHEIRVLNQTININIPAGCQNGQTLRLKGQGMPKYKKENQKGDLYVKVSVSIPKVLTTEEKEIFSRLRAKNKATTTN